MSHNKWGLHSTVLLLNMVLTLTIKVILGENQNADFAISVVLSQFQSYLSITNKVISQFLLRIQ